MKQLKIIVIAILSGLGIFLIGVMVYGINHSFSFDEGGNMGQPQMISERKYNPEGLEQLLVDYETHGDDIYLKKSSGDEIIIREYYAGTREGKPADIYQNEKEIQMRCGREKHYISFFSFFYENAYIEIYLPEGIDINVELVTTGGDIESDIDLKAKKTIYISSVSGDIQLKNIIAEKMKISTTSGEIAIESAQGPDKNFMHVSSTSGSVNIGRLYVSDVGITTVSGDIQVMEGKLGGSITSTSGDILLERVEFTDDIKSSTVSGEVKFGVVNENAYEVNLTTVSGEIETKKLSEVKQEESRIAGKTGDNPAFLIKVSTVSGDIIIR